MSDDEVLVIEYSNAPFDYWFTMGVSTTLDIAKQIINKYFEPDEFKVEKESDEYWIPNMYKVKSDGYEYVVSVSSHFLDRV